MRPTDKITQVEGDLPGEVIKMGLDPNSVAHLMSVLTDLYSDPLLAVIREYSTNAYDSHIAAGVTRPIEVSTPTALSQFLRIQDYGLGLSVDEIAAIYSQYGASTKRDTDDQTGMLGLGSKSALTYTNQFTLVSVKNGVKATVSVSRDTDGTGKMTVVDTRSTDEPNGVKITVPIANTVGVQQKAEHFFSFWDKDTYLLNGSTVRSAVEGYDEMFPGVFVKVGTQWDRGKDYVVMGGVSYPIDSKYLGGDERAWSVIAYVNIGDVHFVPSRESLHYTNKTVKTVESIAKKINAQIVKDVTEKISSAKTFAEAFALRNKYAAVLPRSFDIKYKGEVIPASISLRGYKVLKINPYRGRGKYTFNEWDSITGGFGEYAVLVVKKDFEWTTARKAKVARYKDQEGLRLSKFIVVENDGDHLKISPFLDELKVIKFDDIVLDRNYSGYSFSFGPQKVTVHSWDAKTKTVKVEEISDLSQFAGTKSVFVHYSPKDAPATSMIKTIVKEFKVVAVSLHAGRWQKFSRETGSVHISSFLSAKIERLEKELTNVDKIKMTIDSRHNSWYHGCVKHNVDPSTIDDDDVVTWVRAAQGPYSPEAETYLKFRSMHVEGPKNPLDKYPLSKQIGVYSGWDKTLVQHFVYYINAAYAARKDNP